MACVEQDRVVRRVEHAMERKRQLDHAEVGAEVSPGCRHLLDEEASDLTCELRDLARRETTHIVG